MLSPLEEGGTVTGKEGKESSKIHSVQRRGGGPGTVNGAAKLWLTSLAGLDCEGL